MLKSDIINIPMCPDKHTDIVISISSIYKPAAKLKRKWNVHLIVTPSLNVPIYSL